MVFDIRFRENFKIFVAGPSDSGKTTFVVDLIKNIHHVAVSPPNKIMYYYTEWQSKFDDMKSMGIVNLFIKDDDDISFELEKMSETNKLMVIFDDMMNSANIHYIAQLFSVTARHRNISAVFLSQKMFVNNDYFRQISQNSDYFVVFKNPRNLSEIQSLSSQMTPGDMSLTQIYRAATVEPYSYLLINFTQQCIPQLKFLGEIFKKDGVVRVFVLTNCSVK